MSAAFALVARYWKAALFIVLLALIAGQQVQIAKLKANLSDERLARAGEKLDAAQATRAQEAKYRAEESRRADVQAKEIQNAQNQTALAHSDATAAAGAAGKLRQQVADLVASSRRATADTGSATGGAPTGDALGLLADLFGRADQRAGELAEIADQRGIAGATCQRLYESLMP